MNRRTFFTLTLLAAPVPLAGSGEIPQPSAAAELAPAVRDHLAEARSAGLYRERGPHALTPGLERRVSLEPQARFKAWVFFTDKGVGTEAAYRLALDAVRAGLPERAARRRASIGADLGLDFTDLPVYAPYPAALGDAGLRVRRVSRWLNAASVEGTGRDLVGLESLPFVRRIQPVLVKRLAPGPEPLPEGPDARDARPVQPRSTETSCPVPPGNLLEAAFYGGGYNQLDQIQALELQRRGYSGAGVRVMMLDTGFKKTHPAFKQARLVAEWDFVNEDGNTANEGADPGSSDDHGTGTWGVLGGYGRGALIGPAFAAEFVLAKTEDVAREVHAEEDNYVAALEWADTLGVDVTSASLAYFTFDSGGSYTVADLDGDTAVITVAVDLAAAKGILCVNAAGNTGPGPTSIWTPADADTMLAVGAADSCGVVTSFSSRGPTFDGRIKPEISARGLLTTWASANSNGYGLANGTSLSTPLIGGLAALLKEAHPTWTPFQIRAAVIGTGTLSGTPNNALGYGIARGVSALTFGGSTPEPPRMTLPFRLLIPGDGSTAATGSPTFIWSASVAEQPGDQATYLLIVDNMMNFVGADTFDAGTATSMTPVLGAGIGETRWWKVIATGNGGYPRESMNVSSFTVGEVSAVADLDPVPAPWYLGPALPNPAVGNARVEFRAPAGSAVTLEILDVAGRRVRRYDAVGTGAVETVRWDGRDSAGRATPVGVYFYRLQGGTAPLAGKFILVR